MQGPPDQPGGPPRDHDVAHEAPESPFYRAVGAFVLRWRTPIVVVDVAVTILCLVLIASNVEVANDFEQFLDYDSEARATHAEMRLAFGDDQTAVVLARGDVFSLPYLERLKALHDDLERLEIEDDGAPADGPAIAGFSDLASARDDEWGSEGGGHLAETVVSLVNVRDTRWEDGALVVSGLLDRWPAEGDLPALRARVSGPNRPAGDLVSDDGRASILVLRSVSLADDQMGPAYEDIARVAHRHEAPGFEVSVGGPIALYGAVNGMTLGDLARVTATVNVVMVLALVFLFRKGLRALAPVSALVHAIAWSVGLQVLLGIPVSVITMVLLPMLTCVGIGAVIHVQEVFLEQRERGLPHREALISAVASTGLPVFHTSTTTAAGMASFLLADIPPLRDLGLLVAFGVMVSYLQTIVWLPALLTFDSGEPVGKRDDSVLSRIAEAGDRASRSIAGRRRVILLAALVLAASAWGMARLRITMDSQRYLAKSHEVLRTFEAVDREIGGTNTISVLVEADDVRDRDLLLGLEAVERDLLAYRDADGVPIVTHTTGLLSLLREGWRALHEDQDAYYTLPDTQQAVVDTFTLLESGGADLARVVTIDNRRTLLTLQVQWRDSAQYLPLVEAVEKSIALHLGDRVRAHPTGSVMSHVSVENAIISGQVESFAAACAMVVALLILLVGDVGLGFLAIVPNLLPVAMILGVMGVLGIYVDVQNMLISSLVIGVAVDDTVHLLHQFNSHRRVHGDRDAAIAFAFRHAGRPSIITGVILASGFATIVVSQMPATRVFGLLVATAVLFGLVVELLFTPALLRVVYPPYSARRADADVPIPALGVRN